MSPTRCLCATPVNGLFVLVFFVARAMTSSFFKASELENTGDSSRSSDLGVMSPTRCLCATPVNGLCVLVFYVARAMTAYFFKARELENTGDPFRSSDLGVMSPARCLCATPVKIIRIVPTAGFDPATSPL